MLGMSTQSAKDRLIDVIRQQPDHASSEEILRELALARMIERGLADSDAGRTIGHDEMKRLIDRYRLGS